MDPEETNIRFRHTFIAQYFICLLGIISHILLFLAFIKDPLKCFRNTGIFLVGNLAISDFLSCLFGPFVISARKQSGLVVNISTALNCVSVATIFSISVDRYIMVRHPLRHRLLTSAKVMTLWVVLIWLLSVIYLLKGYIFGISTHDEIIKNCLLSWSIVFAGLLYGGTYFALKKQSKSISLQNSTNTIASRNQEMRIQKEQRFLKTIILVASIAFLCLVPSFAIYQVSLSRELWQKENTEFHVLMGIFASIFYLNFAVNPLIYTLRLPNYRKTFYRLYFKKRF